MSVSEGRPGAGRAVASGVTAEARAMVPTSDSELACWSYEGVSGACTMLETVDCRLVA